ncbi:MAG: hypothetical protein MH204_03535, partial [Fimbriimonadaceae bacterium]|nr:hypothetical protein [Fimbriimonadaceae bacterium]
CRRFGDRHISPDEWPSGMLPPSAGILGSAGPSEPTLAISRMASEARRADRWDSLERALDRLAADLLDPLWRKAPETAVRLTILAPGPAGGLGCCLDSRSPAAGSAPFDERVWDDPKVPAYTLAESVQRATLGGPAG